MNHPPMLQSSLLAGAGGVRHGFFTRKGGVSKGLYGSLNVGVGSNDDPAAVEENRARAAGAFGRAPELLTTCHQIHSAVVVVADRALDGQRPQADGVATCTPGLLCGALAADCAPVLIADPRARVVVAAHAGWRGALGGVVGAAVTAARRLGASADTMVAAVGPCIGPASYEVGPEFRDTFLADDVEFDRHFARLGSTEKWMFDLPAFVLGRLAAAGVREAEWTGHDTFADDGEFFSNRRAFKRQEPDYGRLLSVITLD